MMDRTLTAMSHSPLIGYMGGSVAGRNHYHHLRGSQESDSESSSSLEFDKLLQLPHTHTHTGRSGLQSLSSPTWPGNNIWTCDKEHKERDLCECAHALFMAMISVLCSMRFHIGSL